MYRSPLLRMFGAAVVCAALAGVAMVANQAPPTGARMTTVAEKFLGTLSPEQKKAATFAYDDPHRTAWFFTPQQDKAKQSTRKGLRFDGLNDKQKAAAMELLRTGLSDSGYQQVETIMSLESILADLEGSKGAMTRNPTWYFVSVFGEPSNTGSWGWRIEGHHFSTSFTLEKGEVLSPAPMMFGANPAEVRDGPKKGLRTLPEAEDTAKKLIASLNDEQKKVAVQAKQLPEINEGFADAKVGAPLGIPAEKLNDSQKELLTAVINAYANRMPNDVAKAERDRLKDAGFDKVHFAYCVEADKPGKPYTYRVQGPTFVVEFVNVQADSAKNPANHIHSSWRRLPMDFGLKAK